MDRDSCLKAILAKLHKAGYKADADTLILVVKAFDEAPDDALQLMAAEDTTLHLDVPIGLLRIFDAKKVLLGSYQFERKPFSEREKLIRIIMVERAGDSIPYTEAAGNMLSEILRSADDRALAVMAGEGIKLRLDVGEGRLEVFDAEGDLLLTAQIEKGAP